jgi:hypothetical protein
MTRTSSDPSTDLTERLHRLERKLARRESRQHSAALVLVVSALLVPALAWTASVPNPDFQPGDPISASQINANFAALVDQLSAVEQQSHGAIVISDSSGVFETQSDTSVLIPNNQVQLDTVGGLVRLELAPAPGFNSRLWLIGAGGGADPYLFAYVTFERSGNGQQWEIVSDVDFGGVPSAVGSTALPPGAFTAYDSPPAGTWFYRVVVARKSNAGELTVHVDNVRLVAREIGAAP